jgi:16S rRNA (adenine1518-N6/adenine1519-N6)-dimethyltransferase
LKCETKFQNFQECFKKKLLERICEKKGSKVYGILSVLTQAFYEAEYLFTVNEDVFNPPPKVKSGVLRLIRKPNYQLPCDEKLFFAVVKQAFNQRRKTMRNSLKSMIHSDNLKEDSIFDLRPEQLSVEQFIELTQKIAADGV